MPDASDINLSFELDPRKLRKAGERAVALITERTKDGKDRFGKSFAPYSTTPFAMPAGGTKRKRDALAGFVERGEGSYFQRNGALWAIIEGGYAAYKKERYPAEGAGETVNLTATGDMLGALTVTSVEAGAESGAEVRIGFASAEAAEKAYYHSVAGAGKSETIRDFMGLTEAEEKKVADVVEEAITIRV